MEVVFGHAHAELTMAMHLYRTMRMTFWLPQTEAALAQVPINSPFSKRYQ
jgi:hypothetical protein